MSQFFLCNTSGMLAVKVLEALGTTPLQSQAGKWLMSRSPVQSCAEEPKAQERCTWGVCLCFIPAGVSLQRPLCQVPGKPGKWASRSAGNCCEKGKKNSSCLTFQVRFRISLKSKRMQCRVRCLTVVLNWGPRVQACACHAHCFMLLTITATSEKTSTAPQSLIKDSFWLGFSY